MRLKRLSLGASVGTILLVVLVPAVCSAATVSVGVREAVVYTADPGEVNFVTVDQARGTAGSLVIRDARAALRAGKGCRARAEAVICPFSGEFLASLGDRGDDLTADGVPASPMTVGGGEGDDRIEANGGDATIDDALYGGQGDDKISGRGGEDFVFGGEGADRLKGGGRGDTLYGGAGADRLFGTVGADVLVPGLGNDIARGEDGRDRLVEVSNGSGTDVMVGGRGLDVAVYICPRCEVSLDERPNDGGPAGRDDVRAEGVATPGAYFDGTEEAPVSFPPAEDVISGDSGSNVLHSGFGADVVLGASGKDEIDSGAGDDRVDSRDGEPDDVTCGPGADRARVDPGDRLNGCETVSLPAGG